MMLTLLAALAAVAATPQVDLGGGAPAKREVKVVAVRPATTDVRPGEVVKVAFDLEIPPGWHIYPTTPTSTGTPTMVVIEGLEVAGPYEEPKPKTKPKTADADAYEYHEGAITVTAPLRVKADVKPGPFEAKGVLDYQICSATQCIPKRTPVAFKLAIQEGAPAAAPTTPASSGPGKSFFVMLGFAFVGGLILNVMPCVLPVLTIKLGSLVKQKDLTAGGRRSAALSYTAGIELCMGLIATALIVVRSLGKLVGWGFQFQEPAFVIALSTLIFVFALSLLGVFSVPAMATGAAAGVAKKEGWVKHLLSGFFVTLVATPCSAPFLGSAMGYAFLLPSWGILLFLAVVGLGLASPFLLVGFVPYLLRFLPKPGAWMEVFERIMGFTLLATVVWLADTLGSLTGKDGLTGFLAFLTAVGLGAWIVGHWGSEVKPLGARLASLGAAVLLAVAAGKLFLVTELYKPPVVAVGVQLEGLDFSQHIPWQPFSEESVAAVRAARKPGFIDFTADW